MDWHSIFDRVVVVSLVQSKDRRDYVREHLMASGLASFDFFDATPADDPDVSAAMRDGGVLQYPPCFRCGQLDCGKSDCNNFLLPAQVATFLSYRRLWRSIAEGAHERVLVLEDDVVLHPWAKLGLRRLHDEVVAGRVPFSSGKTCLLRLGWALGTEHDPAMPFRLGTEVRMANPCHALTRGFAAELLRRDSQIRHTVDVYQHQHAPAAGEAWTVFPPWASDLSWSVGSLASTIHPKARRSTWLREHGDLAAADANDQRVALHIKKKHFRALLLVGHPRCGTGYAASLCRQLGVDIGHERVGAAGISSWMFAVDADVNPYALDEVSRTRRSLVWTWLVMPVRDLSHAAGSVVRDSTHAPPSYSFRRDHILRELGIDLDAWASPLARAVWSVTSWCRIVMRQSPDLVFRIEDGQERLRTFLIEKGLAAETVNQTELDTVPVNADKPYKGVRHAKPQFDAADWAALDHLTRQEVRWYAQEFGYRVPTGCDDDE
jgi:hypothetical protein